MENDLFLSEKEQIRKAGEKRYGKGSFRITDQNIYIDYKKVLGKTENIVIPRENILDIEIKKSGSDASGFGPGFGADYKLYWYILDIKLKDGNGFQIYLGQPSNLPKEYVEKMTVNLRAIMELLNPENTPEKFPWEEQ